MPERTIPAPNEEQIKAVRFALAWQSERLGLDVDAPAMAEFIELVVAVQAQQAAEIAWLHKILHAPKEDV